MAKLIKKGTMDLGDITPDTGFAEVNAETRPGSSRVISGKTFEAKAQADGIRNRAEDGAQQILSQAQADAQALLEEAQADADQRREAAHKEGYEAGRNQGAAELAEVVARASQRLQQIEEQAAPQLRDLALTIARKILGRELAQTPDAVLDIVKQALSEKARQRREIFLRINPEDLNVIREHKAELLEVLSRCKEIGIREDPEVKRHGVIIETDAGIIDAQLETQLSVFERILK